MTILWVCGSKRRVRRRVRTERKGQLHTTVVLITGAIRHTTSGVQPASASVRGGRSRAATVAPVVRRRDGPMVFGSGKKIEELEAEVARLTQWVAHLQGTDAVRLSAEIATWQAQLRSTQAAAAAAQDAVTKAIAEEQRIREKLADDLDAAALEETGFYVYRHPLDDAVAYKAALTEAQRRMKDLIRSGRAIESASAWTVNNSAAQGRKMVKDMSTLMLRAYNAEADALVRAVRPHTRSGANSRLEKAAVAIERLGKMMSIRVAPEYHRLRLYEIELTADFMVKKQEEKEAERERRAELREQKRAAAEMLAELGKLKKEQEHYRGLLSKLDPSDAESIGFAEAKLAEISASISGVEHRAANIRTGHVYVISNIGAFGPDMVKIGMTRRLDPYARVMELGDASVPFRFDIHAMIFSEDAVSLETRLHQSLAHRKVNFVNPRREFFYATPAEVRAELSTIAGAMLLEFTDSPEAIEWRASGSVDRKTPEPAADAAAEALEALSDAVDSDGDAVEDAEDSVLLADEGTLPSDDFVEPMESPGEGSNPGPTSAPEAVASEPLSQPDQTTSIEPLSRSERPVGDSGPPPSATQVPAAWYPDPHGVARLRYWDGHTWTSHTAP